MDARAVQRVPLAERWCAATLAAIRATPWCVRPGPLAADAPPLVLQPVPPDVVPPPPPREPPEYRPRNVYITRADLERWGFTAGCRRCTLVRQGHRAQGIHHTRGCRIRIEQALRDAGDPRVERAEHRHAEAALAAAAATAPVMAPAAPAAAPAQLTSAAALPGEGDIHEHMRAAAAEGENAGEGEEAAVGEEATIVGEEAAMGDVQLDDGMLVGKVSMDELTPPDLVDVVSLAPEGVLAEATTLMELLMVHGVEADVAKAKVSELYSPPRVTKELAKTHSMTLVPGSTFDMIADSSGKTWDFRRAEDRARARKQIAEEKPYLVIGSPPCTNFSRLQNLNRYKVGEEELDRRRAEDRVLLDFAVEIYRDQLARNAHFLHEHPLSATTWSEPSIEELRAHPSAGGNHTPMLLRP